jgi:antitoxin HicB
MMKEQSLSKTEMSRRMNTSRLTLERLLDPANQSITLQTLERAAKALGRRLQITLG